MGPFLCNKKVSFNKTKKKKKREEDSTDSSVCSNRFSFISAFNSKNQLPMSLCFACDFLFKKHPQTPQASKMCQVKSKQNVSGPIFVFIFDTEYGKLISGEKSD